ncbi:MAG: hypothetical protein ACM3NR_03515 [Methanosarcina sp.]
MKNFGTIFLLTSILSLGQCMKSYANNQKGTGDDRSANKEIEIGNNLLKISETDTSVKVRVRNRGLSVLESLEGKKSVKIDRYKDNDTLYLQQEREEYEDNIRDRDTLTLQQERSEYEDNHDEKDRNHQKVDVYIEKNDRYSDDNNHWQDRDNEREGRRDRRHGHFKGHWSGFGLGFNNYTTSRDNFAMPDDIDYMTLHSGKSMGFNLNITQVSLGITRHIGFVSGPGLSWNNYRFDGNNNILKGNNGVIERLDPLGQVKKSKFSTLYLTLPFMLEIQMPVNGDHLIVAAGPIGAVKLDSHSKIIYEEGSKVKSDSDFSLNMLRCGATAKVGFSNFQFYGTYYATPLFQKGKGPGGYDLFPFEVGLSISFNN